MKPFKTDSLMDEDPMPEGKKMFWRIVIILVVIGSAIGILFVANQYWGRSAQPSKVDRFLNSVEKIQEDVSEMRKIEEHENQK